MTDSDYIIGKIPLDWLMDLESSVGERESVILRFKASLTRRIYDIKKN